MNAALNSSGQLVGIEHKKFCMPPDSLHTFCIFCDGLTHGAHGAMGRRIDPSRGGLIELFLVPASAPRLV